MNDPIVTFCDDDEHEVSYKRYSARLPDFLKAYPPTSGYRVVVEQTDLLSLQKGRLSLLREAIIAGKKPSDVGLPGIERDVNILVCTSKLLDSQDKIVRSASASKHVIEYKDFEKLETAANQRLLASLGFGGDVFDEDEDADLRDQGLRTDAGTAESAPGTPAPRSTASRPSLTFADDARASNASSDPSDEDAEVTEAERRQVENLAKRVGQPVPSLRSRAEVKAARSRLGALDRQRRGASARPQEAHS